MIFVSLNLNHHLVECVFQDHGSQLTYRTQKDGLTWGGQSWENYNGMATGEETFESVGTDGTINMQASSAVLVYL